MGICKSKASLCTHQYILSSQRFRHKATHLTVSAKSSLRKNVIKYERNKVVPFKMLIAERYEKGSIILTSNKSFGLWGELFGDSVLATAIVDRLLHHSRMGNIKVKVTELKKRKRANRLKGLDGPLRWENSIDDFEKI